MESEAPVGPDEQESARQALEAVAASHAQVAAQMRRGPRWYNAVYGATCGLLILSVGLPQPWLIVGLCLALASFGAIMGAYRSATGILFGGGSPRPRGIIAWLVAVLVVAALASYLDGQHGFPAGVPIVAVFAGVACWALSRRYDAELFALLEGPNDRDARS